MRHEEVAYLTPAQLEVYLSIWSTWVRADRAHIRRLWYPPCTAEYQAARKRAMYATAIPGTHLYDTDFSPDFTTHEQALVVDRALAKLKVHQPKWFEVVEARAVLAGPDEVRAQRLRMGMNNYRKYLYAGQRWLRQAIPVITLEQRGGRAYAL